MVRIYPSIASAHPLRFAAVLDQLEAADGVLHVDIEDGNFIPNITFGMKTVRAIAEYSSLALSVHIMAVHPMEYIAPLLELPTVSQIAVHIESLAYPFVALNTIRNAGKKAGLALNFSTPVQNMVSFLDAMDFALIMCSEPDGMAEEFQPASLARISQARELLGSQQEIWVDGGISSDEALLEVCRHGAQNVVMGRAIMSGTAHPRDRMAHYEKLLREHHL